ncbi:cell division protein FtsZ [Marinifilum caeruleilacunae]|uniref:Cell division protein FtsZ n=1 Tax=Marinifilum caeruleilacunae TaxID=2499076 RepID=A0ABX1WVJ3_9BACT|nr:cell division protein FtsZ [Marinifilum caeruleilacunae]NOU60092.1 cell division protein FtsZ [Marinifilum caeruleilacunae]
MIDELLPVDFEPKEKSIIKVIGVGGGGGNAVNHMLREGITGVDFVICNTDSQALENSPVPIKVQLGKSLTEGRGAGNKPERGRESAIESLDDINKVLSEKTKMVFVTAGMGGGTGTGAAPIIAEAARQQDVLTVGIVTIPFRFEGKKRIQQALEGIENLEKHVDALLIINNEKLRLMYGDLKLSDAFAEADSVLSVAAKSIAEIITVAGYVNVDFADVETVMRNSGVAVMGSASASGPDRSIRAIEEALTSPLLNSNNIVGARNILLNIISGSEEVTMQEVSQITDYVQDVVGDDVSVIWGNGYNEKMGDELSVTIIATGFSENPIPELMIEPRKREDDAPKLELIIENPAEEEEKAAAKRREEIQRREELMRKRSEEQEEEQEEEIFEVKSKVEPKVSQKPKTEQPKAEEEKEGETINNWFKDQFTKIFDGGDTSM